MKMPVAILLAATTLASAAFAQTPAPAPTAPAPAPAASAAVPPQATANTGWRASKLVGVDVYNEQNESIGDISEVILDRNGKVTGYVIGVGGFLGMGVHDIFLAFDQVKFVNEPRPQSTPARPASTGAGAPATGAAQTGMAPATTTRAADGRPASATATRSNDEKWFPNHAVVSATKDQLKGMQQFKYD